MTRPPAGADGVPLAHLIYRSRSTLARRSTDPKIALSAILHQSRRNNERHGLTGVLLFDGETFVQAIEGPLECLETVYEAIACDQRHEDVEVMELSMIDRREYGDWTMAYIAAGASDQQFLRPFVSRQAEPSPLLANMLSQTVRRMLAEHQAAAAGVAESSQFELA
jgi:hypothetical protein